MLGSSLPSLCSSEQQEGNGTMEEQFCGFCVGYIPEGILRGKSLSFL